MSKKAEKKFDRLIEEVMSKLGPFLNKDEMLKMCESIKENAYDFKEGNTITDFANGSQTIDGGTSLLNSEAIVKIQHKYGDEMDWIYIPEGERLDAVAYIGDVYCITRAFWQCKLEDGSDHISELEKIYSIAINKDDDGMEIESVSLTCFDNGKMFAYIFHIDHPEFEVTKALLSDIVADINDKSLLTSDEDSV